MRKPQGLEEYRYRREGQMAILGLGFYALKGCQESIWRFLVEVSAKQTVKSLCSVLLLLFLYKWWGKIENYSLFETSEVDLREGNQVLSKITMLSHDHQTLVQLAIFKICFHLRVELVQPDDIKPSLLGISPAKALRLNIISKDSLVASEKV